jgi:uncharacterized delta-60 repeat protein
LFVARAVYLLAKFGDWEYYEMIPRRICMKNLKCSELTSFVAGKIMLFIFLTLLFSSQIFAYPGRLDLSFRNSLLDGAEVGQIKVQPDGKILITGNFTTRGAIVRQNFARLNADGSVDATFDAGSITLGGIELQSDEKILIGGLGNFKRLNADGSVDPTFNVTGITSPIFISDIQIQMDGKILAYKNCSLGLGCQASVTRFNADGSADLVNGAPLNIPCVRCSITYAPVENKFYIKSLSTLVRYNLDGSLDSTFTANLSGLVRKVAPLGDGKILIWGIFDRVDSTPRYSLAVLNSNGSLDASFVPATNSLSPSVAQNLDIWDAEVQTDGKIIVGGKTLNAGFTSRTYFARLNPDGSLDRTFNQGKATFGEIRAVKIYTGSRLLVGGTFFRFDDSRRRYGLARINLF